MEEKKRSPILGYVGDVPIANTAYSGNLAEMTIDQLSLRFWKLRDKPAPDSDEGFEAKMREMDAICEEFKKKGLSDDEVADIRYPNRLPNYPKIVDRTTWWGRITRIFRS